MDQNTLVSSGHALVTALDADGFSPRLAMWVHNKDVDTWKLWLVPPAGHKDKLDFYRRVANIVTKNPAALGGLSASDTEMILESHPAAIGLGKFSRMPGLGSVSFTANVFNGYLLPDGIILRSNL